MLPILRYSKNNKWFFWMVPKQLMISSMNWMINKWSTAFGSISNPSVFEVIYLVKYFGGFGYFGSHNIKNWFKNVATLHEPKLVRNNFARCLTNVQAQLCPSLEGSMAWVCLRLNPSCQGGLGLSLAYSWTRAFEGEFPNFTLSQLSSLSTTESELSMTETIVMTIKINL